MTRGKTALFLGALDESKRLDLLLEAASEVHKIQPDFRLLVMGAGPEKNKLLKFAETRTWLRMVRPDFGTAKAIALQSADILAIPGRVGLVTIDSFASGVPIVTTPDPFHPPEFEYLENNVNALVASSMNFRDYADSLLQALKTQENSRLRANALACEDKYSIEGMVLAFAEGLKSALGVEWHE